MTVKEMITEAERCTAKLRTLQQAAAIARWRRRARALAEELRARAAAEEEAAELLRGAMAARLDIRRAERRCSWLYRALYALEDALTEATH